MFSASALQPRATFILLLPRQACIDKIVRTSDQLPDFTGCRRHGAATGRAVLALPRFMLRGAMLFKYVPPDRLDIIEKGRIRFSQAGDLNDPFELRPIMQLLSAHEIQSLPIDPDAGDGPNRILTPEVLNAMVRAVAPGLNRVAGLRASVGGAFVVDNNHLAQATFDEAVGVLCLSESPDNLPMWAHYAANHSGFVLGFDERHSFFASMPECPVSATVRQVEVFH